MNAANRIHLGVAEATIARIRGGFPDGWLGGPKLSVMERISQIYRSIAVALAIDFLR